MQLKNCIALQIELEEHMPKGGKKTVTLSFRVSDETTERLDRLCAKMDWERSTAINTALKIFLDQIDKQGGSIIADVESPYTEPSPLPSSKKQKTGTDQ